MPKLIQSPFGSTIKASDDRLSSSHTIVTKGLNHEHSLTNYLSITPNLHISGDKNVPIASSGSQDAVKETHRDTMKETIEDTIEKTVGENLKRDNRAGSAKRSIPDRSLDRSWLDLEIDLGPLFLNSLITLYLLIV